MKVVTVTVGPLATADADGYATSQAGTGAFAATLDGALATGFSATNIAAAQAVASATDLTLNGTTVSNGVAYLGSLRSVTITSAGNDSGISFTAYGAIAQSPSSPGGYVFGSQTVTGANVGTVSTSTRFITVTRVASSAAAAGNVSVGTNGYIVADKARRAIVTSGGNDLTKTFTFTGTDWSANPITEALTGASGGAAQTVYDFATIDLVVMSAKPASGITIGTNGVASSRPIFLDLFTFAPTSLQVVVSGTANFSVQQSLDELNPISPYMDAAQPGNYANVTWFNHPDSAFVAASASAQGNYAYIPNVTRITLNSGTGSVTYKVLQAASPT